MAILNVSELEQVEKFHHLQLTLSDRWKTSESFDNNEADILIIPSLSLDQRELQKIEGCEHYEERLLFSLIRLQNPRTRLIYVTSVPLHPSIIDYYLLTFCQLVVPIAVIAIDIFHQPESDNQDKSDHLGLREFGRGLKGFPLRQ